MVIFFVALLVLVWGYKLVKILLNSKKLVTFAKEFDWLSERHKYSDIQKSERYKSEAKHYRSVNKKATISSLLWFLFEVVSILLLYFVFVQKYFAINLG